MPSAIAINKHERVIAVVPEYCSGPGWANAVAWVHIHDVATGTLRSVCLQPEDRTEALHQLFSVGAIVCSELISAVQVMVKG